MQTHTTKHQPNQLHAWCTQHNTFSHTSCQVTTQRWHGSWQLLASSGCCATCSRPGMCFNTQQSNNPGLGKPTHRLSQHAIAGHLQRTPLGFGFACSSHHGGAATPACTCNSSAAFLQHPCWFLCHDAPVTSSPPTHPLCVHCIQLYAPGRYAHVLGNYPTSAHA